MLGVHVSEESIGDIHNNCDKIGDIIQIYMSGDKYKSKKDYNFFIEQLKTCKTEIIIHTSNTINLSRDWDIYSWWLKMITIEIETAHELKSKYVVVHFGKKMNLTKAKAWNNMFSILVKILTMTRQCNNTIILIETGAGQGTQICTNIKDIAKFYKKFNKLPKNYRNRIGLCFDTCHMFASGYDLTSPDKIDQVINLWEKLIGWNHVKLIHLNDSKKQLGSKVDRHANIGDGYIGKDGLSYFYRQMYLRKIPIILETPSEKHKQELEYLANLQK
jgi:deoxyribonuclease-4